MHAFCQQPFAIDAATLQASGLESPLSVPEFPFGC
jgi:hypothetical protein